MRVGGIAHDPAGIGIVEPLLHLDLGRDQPGVEHPADDADRDIHVAEAGAEHRDDGDDQHQEREGDDGIDEAAEHRLHDSRRIADQGADEGAEDERDDRAKSAICRSMRIGVDDARQHVAAEIVGAERDAPGSAP